MADLWLPGFERVDGPRSGGTYRRPDVPPRLVGHTTETATGSARRLAGTHLFPPHVWVDPVTRERYQTVPLNRSAYALEHPDGAVETNHANCVQVEVIWSAALTPLLTGAQLDWLGEAVFGPMCEAWDVPFVADRTFGPADGLLASVTSRYRMTPDEWLRFSGVTTHQRVPANAHWDMGRIDLARIVAAAKTAHQPEEVFDVATAQEILDKVTEAAVRAADCQNKLDAVLAAQSAQTSALKKHGAMMRDSLAALTRRLAKHLGAPVEKDPGDGAV